MTRNLLLTLSFLQHDVSNRAAEPVRGGGATEKTEQSVLETPPPPPLRRSNRIEALKQQLQHQR